MKVLLYIYLAGAYLAVLRLGWAMLFTLDKYDWTYGTVWRRFSWQVPLWPVLTPIFPQAILDPRDFLTDDEAAFRRELDKFRKNSPPCGPLLRLCPKQGSNEVDPPCFGEFHMKCADVKSAYREHCIAPRGSFNAYRVRLGQNMV